MTLLVWNHIENKHEISKYKSFMYTHVPMNVGVIDLLTELFTNNKPLLFSEREIPTVIHTIVSECDRLSSTKYYKSKVLIFLKSLLIYNSKSIVRNQLLVMQKI